MGGVWNVSIHRLFDVEKLDKYIEDGYISRRSHPHLDLYVLDYTAKCQFDSFWNKITLHCRGLVVNSQGDIVGNCLNKFFNYDDPTVANVLRDGPVHVTDKLDGSYLAVSLYKDELIVNTRASFESEQALVAKAIIDSRPDYQAALQAICAEATAIFEVIYPANRIVLDYRGLVDIVFIGAVARFELTDGKQLWTPADKLNWPGRSVEHFEFKTYAEAIAMPPRENAEGIVIYFERTGERLKVKQDDYKALHFIMTNCTAKRLWAHMAVNATKHLIDIDKPKHWASYLKLDPEIAKQVLVAGEGWLDKYITNVPDEFYQWVQEKLVFFPAEVERLRTAAQLEYERLLAEVDGDRSKFFALIRKHPLNGLLSLIYDNKSIELLLWLMVKPLHETPFMESLED